MRRISVCLLFLFTLLVLVGCQKEPSLPASTAHVFRATTIAIPDADYGVLLDEGATWDGKRFTINTYLLDRDNGGYWLDFSKTYTFLPDGTGITEELPTSSVTSVQPDALPDKVVDLPSGDTLSTEVVTVDEKLQYYVSVRDAKGNAVFSTDLAEVFHFDYTQVKEGNKTFTLLDAVVSDGKYLVLTTGGLCAFDEAGTLLWVEDSKDAPTALSHTAAGILYLYVDNASQFLRFVDPATGELTDSITFPEEMFGENKKFATFHMGPDYDLYVKTNLALWGLMLTTAEDGTVSCECEKIIDWVNSDLSPVELDAFCIADEHTITAVWHDTIKQEDTKLLLLTYVAPEDVVIKKEIQLAMMTTDYTMARAIADYNRQSSTHRIVVTDYSIYDKDIRRTRLDTAVASGNAPDIVFFPDEDNMVEDYSRAGLFLDLSPWLAETYGDALLGTVTKPYQNSDGQQFVFPTVPIDTTYWGKADYLDGVPTLAELLTLMQELPEDTYLFESERLDFWYLAYSAFVDMVDLEAGECHFDSEAFLEICEKLLPMESTEKRTGTILLAQNRMGYVSDYVHAQMRGEVPVGLSNHEGKLYLTSGSDRFFAIYANSTMTKECYTFIDQYRRDKVLATDVLFTKQDVYDTLSQYEGYTYFLQPNGTIRTVLDADLDDPKKMSGITGQSFKITKSDADAYIAFLDRFDGRLDKNSTLYTIFWEEMMDNGRTAQEVATAIQSRASIYLAENS